MKNQYFGDKTDYLTYGLLRALTGGGASSLALCWMLTPDDGRTDGRNLGYLEQPGEWRRCDPALFDRLYEAVRVQGRREISVVAESGILPGARLYEPVLPDDAAGRKRYFAGFWKLAEGCDLVFFDPDNGMEVRSKPYAHNGSSRYLYWHELNTALERGFPALVIQHFRREQRQHFIKKMVESFFERTAAQTIYAFRTVRVVFFLLLHRQQDDLFLDAVENVKQGWQPHIQVSMLQRKQSQ